MYLLLPIEPDEEEKTKNKIFNKKNAILLITCFAISFLLVLFQKNHVSTLNKPKTIMITYDKSDAECSCKSLFTIGGCDLNSMVDSLPLNRTWTYLLQNLHRARIGETNSLFDLYHELSRYMPNVYNSNQPSNRSKPLSKYQFSGNNTFRDVDQVPQYERINIFSRLFESLPYVPCKIHNYSDSDIKQCLAQRKKITGQPLRIAFVGDSQVRNLLQQIIMRLREPLELKTKELAGKNLTIDFLDTPVKIDFLIHGRDIEMKLYWSTFLARKRKKQYPESTYQGAKDVLTAWNINGAYIDGQVIPDMIYFDNGMWTEDRVYPEENVDNVRSDFENLSKTLSDLSKKTRLVFRPLTPFKHWIAKTFLQNKRLDFENQIAWLKLVKTGTWIWDTITPVYLKEIDECWNHWRTGYGNNLPKLWNCADFQHLSRISENVASNMIWNYFCNDILNLSDSHCCVK